MGISYDATFNFPSKAQMSTIYAGKRKRESKREQERLREREERERED